MSAVEHYEVNKAGRDFIVGDIHGCFDLLRSAIKKIGFDESVDRLFSVGDLVDRGPKSEECLEWIAKDWFHPVRANHEQMAINFYAGHNHAFLYEQNGGRWFIDLPNDLQRLYAEVFMSMPIALDIWTDNGLVGVVHAEPIPHDWREFCRLLDAGDSQVANDAMWSRDRINYGDGSIVKNVSSVYVGHTPLKHPISLGNVNYIDTGAVFGGPLTLTCISHYMLQVAA